MEFPHLDVDSTPQRQADPSGKIPRYNQILPRLKSWAYTRSPVILSLGLRFHYWLKNVKLRRELKNLRPHVLHALEISGNGIEAFLSGFNPYVLSAWGSDIRRIDDTQNFRSRVLKRSLLNATRVTGSSQNLIEECSKHGVKEDRLFMVGMPGIKVANYQSAVRDDSLLKDLGVAADRPAIFSPRAMSSLYRIHIIVEAFDKIVSKMEACQLILMRYNANPEYEQMIYQSVHDKGISDKVVIVDALPNAAMKNLYQAANVVVSIPETDGMPQTIFEAFASCRLVVASDLKTYDGILDHGVTGLRVSGTDSSHLSDTIIDVLNSPNKYQHIISEAESRVKSHGDLEREMNKMCEMYHSIMLPQR